MENLTTSRRAFMHQLAALAGVAMIPPALRGGSVVGPGEITDEQICQRKFALAVKESLQSLPIGDVMITVGSSFIGTPYAAHTLEQPGEERLVVNLRGFDCVTFVESTLALSRCIKLGKHTFEEYKKQLQLVRYRGGKISGYPSRLHYFSDWIGDNETKNVVRNISQELGGVLYEKKLDFISTYPMRYWQLANPVYLEKIKEIESAISARRRYFVPNDQIKSVENKIEPGDVIGIVTTVEGLDIVHTGIAARRNGVRRYLHAPLVNGPVQISRNGLSDYLLLHSRSAGIMVARPLEP